MGLDTGPLGPRICDRSSRGNPGMGTRVSIHRTACLSDLVRQRPLSASRGETRGDTYRNRHPCTFGAEDSRLETSARRLTRKRTPRARPPDRQLHASRICIVSRPGVIPASLAQARFARNLRRQAESSTSYRTSPTVHTNISVWKATAAAPNEQSAEVDKRLGAGTSECDNRQSRCARGEDDASPECENDEYFCTEACI